MALIIPPPPTSADQNSRVWTDWYVKLSAVLSSTAGVAWALVDKAGSKISDLANHNHSQLSSINGTGDYHVSSSEAGVLTTFTTNNMIAVHASNIDPTSTDIGGIGHWRLWENTSLGEVRIWAVNNAGVVKKSAAFT